MVGQPLFVMFYPHFSTVSGGSTVATRSIVAGDGFPRLRSASHRERRRGGRRCGQRRRSVGLPATRWDRASAEIPSGKHTKKPWKITIFNG